MNHYQQRVLLGLSLWILTLVWAIFFPGASHHQTETLVNSLIQAFSNPTQVNAYLFVHFCLMGVWPWIILAYWLGETPFRGSLWAKLVVFLLSNVVGAFIMLPYEALRSSEAKRLPPRWLFRLGLSRWFAFFLLAVSTLLLLYAVVEGGFWEYVELLNESNFVRIMLVDFFLFHVIAIRLIWRDIRDKDSNYHPAQLTVFFTPLLGPLFFLLFRKQLEAAHPAMIRY